MTYHGTVRNGIIELENGSDLPDGAVVRVELVEEPPEGPANEVLPALFTWGRRAVHTGQSDLATNLDHYLYGHPKVSDGER